MDSTSKLEERLCNSPESGFGSEHQYSPVEQRLDDTIPSKSPEEMMPGTSSEKTISEEVFSFDADHDNDAFSCLKIVNVQSLAVSPPSQAITPTIESLTEFKIKVVDGATRLLVHHQNNKKVLILDPSLTSSDMLPFTNINFPNCNSDERESPICIPFSGLPVISRRKRFKIDDSHKDNFVVSMLNRDDRKRYHSINLSLEKSQSSLGSNTDLQSCAKDTNTVIHYTENFADTKPTDQELKLALGSYIKQKPPSSCSFSVTSESLHSSSITTSFHKTSTGTRTAEDISGSTCEKLALAKQQMVESILTTNNESKKNICVKQELSNNKVNRIKRLKELLQQKEKNLQEVRKNFGFIS